MMIIYFVHKPEAQPGLGRDAPSLLPAAPKDAGQPTQGHGRQVGASFRLGTQPKLRAVELGFPSNMGSPGLLRLPHSMVAAPPK